MKRGTGKQIIKFGADLAVGGKAAEEVSEQIGVPVVGAVVAGATGLIAGALIDTALEAVDKETGIISDLGSLVDDIFDIF